MENIRIVKYLKYCIALFIPVGVGGFLLGGMVWSELGLIVVAPLFCIVALVVLYVRNIVKHGIDAR